MEYVYAKKSDLKEIKQLLNSLGLPSSDIGPHVRGFVIAKTGKLIVGVVGMEVHGKDCLLRSLAVRPSHQGMGIAKELFCRIVADAQKRGIVKAYVLTTTIEILCQKWGFNKIPKTRVPHTIIVSKEFQGLCPKTAVLMCKNIAQDVK